MRAACRSWIVVFGLALIASAPARGADLDRCLPADTELVLVVNVRQILDASVVKKYVRERLDGFLQDNAEVQQLVTAFGPGSFKDLARVTVAMPKAAIERRGLVLLHGRFSLEAIHAAADRVARDQPETLKVHRQGQARVYEILGDDPDRPFGFAAFPDPETMAFSPSRDTLQRHLARAAGQNPPAPDKGFRELVARVDGKQSLWVAGRVPDQVKSALEKMPQLKPFAGKLETFSGGVRLGDGVKAGFHLQVSDAQAAVDLRQTLELSKLLVSVVIANDQKLKDVAPLLTDILGALHFTQDQRIVGIELTLLDSQIEQGLKKKPQP
jgi:hypothetical protein